MPRTIIGLVGYYQFMRGYPLGPELRLLLESFESLQESGVTLKEMNWGPIAIVQDFEASSEKVDRIVLVAVVNRGLPAGTVTCRHWQGGKLDLLAVQDRVFEAVTGVIDLDNLLVIGEHFGIWPEEVLTVEAHIAETGIGDFILSEIEIDRQAAEISIIGNNPLSPDAEKLVTKIAAITHEAAMKGVKNMPGLIPLTVDDLTPLTDVCHNQFTEDCKITARRH